MKKIKILLGLLVCTFLGNAQVVTFAGSEQGCAEGNTACLAQPNGMVFDADGNLFIADTFNNQIKKITPKGLVSVFAGSTQGYSDGKSSNAQFNAPIGITIDAAGNLYVADSNNNKIRKITADGMVTTLAGSTQGFADAAGKSAQFFLPSDVAVDLSGNVYVTDTYNNKIRKITPTGMVSTLAGSSQGYADGTATAGKFDAPQGIAIDDANNLYVTDGFNNKIRKITSDGIVTTLDFKTEAQFNFPSGIAIDRDGNLFVCDQQNHKIKKITSKGAVSTIAGSAPGYTDGKSLTANFYYPWGIAVDIVGNIYVADTFNNRIREIFTKPHRPLENFKS